PTIQHACIPRGTEWPSETTAGHRDRLCVQLSSDAQGGWLAPYRRARPAPLSTGARSWASRRTAWPPRQSYGRTDLPCTETADFRCGPELRFHRAPDAAYTRGRWVCVKR